MRTYALGEDLTREDEELGTEAINNLAATTAAWTR